LVRNSEQNTLFSGMMKYLEVEVIDSGKGTQAVVTKSKVRACSLSCHVQCKHEAFMINSLRQTVKHPRNEKHMTILDRTHLQPIKSTSVSNRDT
jgi:hypothetical protein